ncbi:MAG: NAD(P)-dependent alcohol dehydrogenase [Oligoflexales bacterium]|nr:NAD(P)-dependent alcohol dehydrogenase [Oligoflexales bacterium]
MNKQTFKVHGYAAKSKSAALSPYTFERREPGEHELAIEIQFCGVCHSDIHQVRDEWGGSIFPMVPGHEIVGNVSRIGSKVKKFSMGDLVGVGCIVDSCRTCQPCKSGEEQYCDEGFIGTYNSQERGSEQVTMGGYSSAIVVHEDFVLKVPKNLNLSRVAPLLCAGITMYSPLKHWKISSRNQVAILGLGGLGHMGVKLARAFGAQVTVFTSSSKKREDAHRLGAHEVVLSSDASAMRSHHHKFDFIIDTISADHDVGDYLQLLRRDGSLVMVGLPERPLKLNPSPLIFSRRNLSGSLIGGIAETQEMLDFCGTHEILSDVELIPIGKINEAYERMIRGDVKYRFVIDMTL